MTALHSKPSRCKAGNSSGNAANITKSNLFCTACNKRGHVESTCWAKYPHLKDKSKPSIAGEARVAFHMTANVAKTARKAHIGGHGANGTDGCNPDHWILDSGASEHFTPYKHVIANYKTLDEPVEVNTAKGKLLGIGTGSVHITVEGQDGYVQVTLEEVLHVPGMDSNLLSSNVLLVKGLEISMHPTRGTSILLGDIIIAKTVPHGKLLRLKTISGENEFSALKTVGRKPIDPQPKPLSYSIWHRRFVRLGPWNLQKAQKLVTGMAIDPETLPKEGDGYTCEACISGSQTRNLSDAPMKR